MISKLFGKKTKWVPLGFSMYGYSEFLVLSRKNLKTGMIYFKCKKVQKGKIDVHEVFNRNYPISPNVQWNKLQELKD